MANYDKYGFITELGKNEIFVFGSNGQGAYFPSNGNRMRNSRL